MKITNEYSLKNALHDGVNLFVGSGFSTESWDANNNNLPVGNNLAKELADKFNKNNNYTLAQLSSILTATAKRDFYQFLIDRFSVHGFSPLYNNVAKINIKSIYTTNIDNLIYKIFEKSKKKYIRDQALLGPSTDNKAINYLPLHGCILDPERGFVFDVNSLANIYNDVPRIWSCLSRELEMRPTIFIGYSFSDSSVIQALTSQQTFQNCQKEKWIVLRNEDLELSEFYSSQGFSVIEANLDEILTFFGEVGKNDRKSSIDDEKMFFLKPYIVPTSLNDITFQRPIRDFFEGSNPQWCDIISNQLYRTQYFSKIQNSIYNPNKNTIIIGSPVSGKTTIMMQVACAIEFDGLKLFFSSLSEEKAEFLVKIIDSDKAIIFVDNLYDSIDSLPILEKPNIKLVCAERSHNFSIISHLAPTDKYDIINVTTLNDQDLQGVFNSLPQGLRNEYLKKETELRLYGKDSIFEFVIRNINTPNIKDRYKNAIQKLENDDKELAEFLILCAYMHNCHIPLSFEMAYDYFDTFNRQDIFDLKDDSCDIVKDYIPNDAVTYENMDYYYPRSYYIAEIIIDACSAGLLKRVIWNVIRKIPSFRICDYRKFRKYAFDKNIIAKAFPDWNEGKSYYEEAFLYDNRNPYVLQQGALYLSGFGQYDLAFGWIDKAINMTNNKFFSIRNSHAIILFNANISKTGDKAKAELDNSMEILEKCINNDARKKFHANTYGQQAIRYYKKFGDAQARTYLLKAKEWLDKEIKDSYWDKEISKTREDVDKTIQKVL